MKRILVLAVDRDDDFGVKAGIETPVVGLEAVTYAALRLGAEDPEDSDVNSLFAAIRIYNELHDEGKDVSIALLCGDKKVGHKSDSAIIDELEQVLVEVEPERVVLVSDGAEDEYVYPIISSRIPIDSVRKVYVKQSPGLEGSLYILSKLLKDREKKKRFLAPIGWIVAIFGMVFLVPEVIRFLTDSQQDHLYSMTGSIVVVILGVIFLLYGYSVGERMQKTYTKTMNDVKTGNLSIMFTVLAFALFICGLVLGINSVIRMRELDEIYLFLSFASNLLWLLVFALICHSFGKVLDSYIKSGSFNRVFLVGTVTILAIAFVAQAMLDIISSASGYVYSEGNLMVYELIIGIVFGICAALLQVTKRKDDDTEGTEADAVQ